MTWKTLKDNIPLLSVLSVGLIVLGLVKQMIYYNHFNIQIQYYISPSELFLVLADKMMLIIYFLGTEALLSETLLFRLHSQTEKKLEEKKEKKWKIFRFEIIIIISLLAIVLLSIFGDDYFMIAFITLWSALFFYPIVFFGTVAVYKENAKKDVNKKAFHFGFLMFMLLGVIIILAIGDIGYTEKGKYNETKIFTKDSTYVSDKNHFYIGKTQNYYFIYNKDSLTLVIPEREVTKFDLKTHAIK